MPSTVRPRAFEVENAVETHGLSGDEAATGQTGKVNSDVMDNGSLTGDFKPRGRFTAYPPRDPAEMPPPTLIDKADMVLSDLDAEGDYSLTSKISGLQARGIFDPADMAAAIGRI